MDSLLTQVAVIKRRDPAVVGPDPFTTIATVPCRLKAASGERQLMLPAGLFTVTHVLYLKAGVDVKESDRIATVRTAIVADPQGYLDGLDADSNALYTSGGDTPTTWTWEPANSRLKADGGNQATLLRVGSSIQDVEVEIEMLEAPTDAGIIARHVDNNNHYVLTIKSDTLVLYKRVAGSFTQLGTTPITWSAGVHTIKLRVEGSTLTVSWDGTALITVTDTTFAAAAGNGLRNHTAASYFYKIDVTDLGEAGALVASDLRIGLVREIAAGDGTVHHLELPCTALKDATS